MVASSGSAADTRGTIVAGQPAQQFAIDVVGAHATASGGGSARAICLLMRAATIRHRASICRLGERRSARKHDPRACDRHADRTNTRSGYPKIARVWRRGPSVTKPG
jgi:hypothetical protein